MTVVNRILLQSFLCASFFCVCRSVLVRDQLAEQFVSLECGVNIQAFLFQVCNMLIGKGGKVIKKLRVGDLHAVVPQTFHCGYAYRIGKDLFYSPIYEKQRACAPYDPGGDESAGEGMFVGAKKPQNRLRIVVLFFQNGVVFIAISASSFS